LILVLDAEKYGAKWGGKTPYAMINYGRVYSARDEIDSFQKSGDDIDPGICRHECCHTGRLRQGPGLGLSVSYYILAEDHGGEMNVQPGDGGGTCFVIRLPKQGKG
jgi:hypothetical protein